MKPNLLTVRCCKCQKTRVGEKWIFRKDAAKDVDVSHGFCPTCFSAEMLQLDTLQSSLNLTAC